MKKQLIGIGLVLLLVASFTCIQALQNKSEVNASVEPVSAGLNATIQEKTYFQDQGSEVIEEVEDTGEIEIISGPYEVDESKIPASWKQEEIIEDSRDDPEDINKEWTNHYNQCI